MDRGKVGVSLISPAITRWYICRPLLFFFGGLWTYLLCVLQGFHHYSFQVVHILAGMYDVERQTSIKVNELHIVSLIYLTATQGGALRMADLCMLIAPSHRGFQIA